MPRDLAISNGRLLVMFDRQYRIRDLYLCPSCGQARHPTERRSDRQIAMSEA
jgi:hypothetical protein